MREIRIGEEVVDRDGRRLGRVERLVVDERAHRLSHLVIDGRLVGLRRLRDQGQRLVADLGRAELEAQPEAHPGLVGAPGRHWRPPPGYVLDDFLRVAEALIGQQPYVPPVRPDPDLSAVHEIAPGGPVWVGRDRVGEVSRVLTDDAGRVRDLVVRTGGLVRHEVLVPVDRVQEVVGTNVHLDLTREEMDRLPRYREG
ncbi:MAG TPA: PRC-barrel domain-containing protein [Candidatus Dormibacteraeota bacterium]|jgi:sporulation protein YlmC with PRC-barrel domain|nr:PRC-barrel domain-containing protein [Candidatus Dormibacteraeota bacterium]